MVCQNCGRECGRNARYCTFCGAPVESGREDTKKSAGLPRYVKIIIVVCILLTVTSISLFTASLYYSSPNQDNTNDKIGSSEIHDTRDNDSTEKSASAQSDANDDSPRKFDYDNDGGSVSGSRYADASSCLDPIDDLTYYPENAMDGDYYTAWVEGADGNGEGEWLCIPTNSNKEIAAVEIANGYQKSEDIYYKNNRVKDAVLIFDDGTSESVTLSDEYGKSQVVILSEKRHSSSIKIRIKTVYPGSKWQDTCITEMGVGDVAADADAIIIHSTPGPASNQ